MITILAVGDVHIKLDNIHDIQLLIQRLELEIIRVQPDVLILLGDVLHTHERIHTTCLNQAEQLFHMCTKHVDTYVLVGNHDYISNSQFLTTHHWMTPFKCWPRLTIVDHVVPFFIKGKQFVACPYVPDGRFIEALDTFPDWIQSSLIFGHQSMNGVKMGAILVEHVEEWKSDYPFLCSGHIHDKQRIQPNLYYTGTPMQHAFGEKSNKTICLFTVSEHINLEEIDLKVSKKRIEYISVEQAYHYSLTIESHESVRLTIKGTKEECMTFKKSSSYQSLCKMAKIAFDEIELETVQKEETSSFQDVLYSQLQSNFFLTKLYKQYASLPHTTPIEFV